MGTEGNHIDFSKINVAQLGNNFLQKTKNGEYTVDDLNQVNNYLSYILNEKNRDVKHYKVGVMMVCINQPYWQFISPIVNDIRGLFLPGHETEIMVWSDLPEKDDTEAFNRIESNARGREDSSIQSDAITKEMENFKTGIKSLREAPGLTFFPVESAPWPYPTLMRYHFFLQQEEYLKKFDYIFYLDLDMRIVNVVGDEILGSGLTAAAHPMYYVRRHLWPPYEPNSASQAYIKRPGRVITEDGKPVFQPTYAAGGFQGGTTDTFIQAMKSMKKSIDQDFAHNYVAIWNDESHWNKYLFDNPPSLFLTPSYVYPDSMINEYYKKVWGRDFTPRIITLTKKFTTSKEGGDAARKMMETL